MKIYKFFIMQINILLQTLRIWHIVVIAIVALFVLGGISTVFAEQKIEEKLNVGNIPDTNWVQFLFDSGEELYICVTPNAEVYQIRKDGDGQVSSKTSTQSESFDYIYKPNSDSENICLKDMYKLPKEIQTGIHRGIYWADVISG